MNWKCTDEECPFPTTTFSLSLPFLHHQPLPTAFPLLTFPFPLPSSSSWVGYCPKVSSFASHSLLLAALLSTRHRQSSCNPSPPWAERSPRMADFFYTTKERSTRGEITRGFGYHLQSCLCVHSFGLPVLAIPFILFLPLILYSVRPPVL